MDADVECIASTWEKPDEKNWARGSPWLWLLIASWVIFELTASATLAVVVFCGKFGWNDVRTAQWLRKADPDSVRASVCGWFYIASALWKVSLAAVATLVVVIALVLTIGDAQGEDAPAEFVAAATLTFFASGISSLVTWLAVMFARRSAVKVWVEPAVHRARRSGVWPPHQYCRANQAGYLLIAATLCPAAPLVLLPFVAALLLHEAVRNDALEQPMLAAVCGSEFLIIWLVDALKKRVSRAVIAIVPEECWGKPRVCDDRRLR